MDGELLSMEGGYSGARPSDDATYLRVGYVRRHVRRMRWDEEEGWAMRRDPRTGDVLVCGEFDAWSVQVASGFLHEAGHDLGSHPRSFVVSTVRRLLTSWSRVAVACSTEPGPVLPCDRAADYFPFESGASWLYAREGATPTDGQPTHVRSTVAPYDERPHVYLLGTEHGYFTYTIESTWTCDPAESCEESPARRSVWGVGRTGVSLLAWQEETARFLTDFPVGPACLSSGLELTVDVDWKKVIGFTGYADDGSELVLSVDRAACSQADGCWDLGLDWEAPRPLSDPGMVPYRLRVARAVGIVAFEDALGWWELVDGAD